MTEDLEVLIVGAGATGLTLACDLQRRGVRLAIVDASTGGFRGSRAKGVQPRTAEVFDDLGVLAGLEARSSLYPPMAFHLGPVTIRRTMIRRREPTAEVPHPNTLLVPQSATDLSLRERLEDLGGRVDHGTRLVAYEQDATGVTADLAIADGVERVRSRYLVGADGGSSTVRRSAGIAFTGTTDESDRMIVADLSLTGLSADRWHIWLRTGGRFMGLCPLPDGSFQLMLRLRPDDPADLDPEAISALIHRFTGRARLAVREILWSSVWRPNTRLAEHYRQGNVLLAGDAAHVHPPTGAQGLNTGVQDAYNLGWKLAQVLAGAPDSLLETYESERRPVAARVLGLSTKLYGQLKSRPVAATARGDEERQLTLSYRGGPLAPSSSAATGPVVAGDRAPDSSYTDVAGRRGTLFDQFRGPQFTLVVLGSPAGVDALRASWAARGAGLNVVELSVRDNAALHRTYGLEGAASVLVRPDGYVAAVAAEAGDLQHSPTVSIMTPATTTGRSRS